MNMITMLMGDEDAVEGIWFHPDAVEPPDDFATAKTGVDQQASLG
jgi:hypothetical protein